LNNYDWYKGGRGWKRVEEGGRGVDG